MRRTRHGLSLIEMVLTIAVLLVISVMTVQSVVNAVNLNKAVKLTDSTLRAPMNILRRELQLAFLADNTPGNLDPERYQTVFVGEDSDPDQLWFATRAHQRRYRDARESDQAEITLFAERMPRIDGVSPEGSVLYHRESPFVDHEPDEGGVVLPLAYNVESFNLRYLDGTVNEWKDEWDSRKAEFLNRLPRAVEVSMVLLVPDPKDPDRMIEKPHTTQILLEFSQPIVQQAGGQGFGQ